MSKETVKSNFRVIISRLAYLTPVGVENFAARMRETYPDATVEVLYEWQEVCSFCGKPWTEEAPHCCRATQEEWRAAQLPQGPPFGPGDVVTHLNWAGRGGLFVLLVREPSETKTVQFFGIATKMGAAQITVHYWHPDDAKSWLIIHKAGKEEKA